MELENIMCNETMSELENRLNEIRKVVLELEKEQRLISLEMYRRI